MSIPPASFSESYRGKCTMWQSMNMGLVKEIYTADFWHLVSLWIFSWTCLCAHKGKQTKKQINKNCLKTNSCLQSSPPSQKMWFTRRSSQCCTGWESTLRTSQQAQNSLKRGNGWGWGSFFCSQRASPADTDQAKAVLTCRAALGDSPPLFSQSGLF